MNGTQRRKEILKRLSESGAPISASALAAELSVSRQIIVGDIALLRSEGAEILATPRGYVVGKKQSGLIRQIACRHNAEEMEDELNAIVDNGCSVIDVIVEHPVYGQITGPLALSNRYEVQSFVTRVESIGAPPLSLLTEGVHLHTIACPDEAAFTRVIEKLRALGVLLEA